MRDGAQQQQTQQTKIVAGREQQTQQSSVEFLFPVVRSQNNKEHDYTGEEVSSTRGEEGIFISNRLPSAIDVHRSTNEQTVCWLPYLIYIYPIAQVTTDYAADRLKLKQQLAYTMHATHDVRCIPPIHAYISSKKQKKTRWMDRLLL